jgi:hypothetical protein
VPTNLALQCFSPLYFCPNGNRISPPTQKDQAFAGVLTGLVNLLIFGFFCYVVS